MEHSSHPSDKVSVLDHFRANTRRLTIHPLELAALWIVSTHCVVLPWLLGGIPRWAQFVSVSLAALGLSVALISRHYTVEHTGSNAFRLVMWPRLLKFPLFWIGAALLGLVVVQILNPAWAYRTDGKVWWMEAVPHVDWLPSGVDVPVEKWGPWRRLLVYASVWLVACTVWVGFTRRRTLQLFLTAIALNGLLLASFGIAQRLFGNGKIFWSFESPNSSFFASFIYKNHGGVYLDLTLCTACGLAAWYYLRGLRRLEKSNPSSVFAFFAVCIAVSVLTSYARGATVVMLAFLVICIALFVLQQLLAPSEQRRPAIMVVLVLVFGYFLKTGLAAVRSGEAWDRLKQGLMNTDLSLTYREYATQASLEMLGDHWKQGTGAGSFGYLFPTYQHRHTELIANHGAPMFWEHAHNDIVEFPIELGAVGTFLLLAGGLFLLQRLFRSYFWSNPLSGSLVLGVCLVFGHSWWDFPFQNPPILMLSLVLLICAAMWAALEERNARI